LTKGRLWANLRLLNTLRMVASCPGSVEKR
jgi:hypothetical protein